MNFPYFNTKELSDGRTYNLTDPAERLQYFHAKLGSKIDEVKEYLEHNSFVGYMLAKKIAGKGTYAGMFTEIVGQERFAHISAGDVVRDAHVLLDSPEEAMERERKELLSYIDKHYRGYISAEEAIKALLNRSNDRVSVPSELMLTLLKREIDRVGKKALFVDGMPRSLDQISYSLYFRDLINYRNDPDFFIFIDVAEEIIDMRIRGRVVCPVCKTSKNMLTNPGKFVRHDTETGEYYLVCDNAVCPGYEKARYYSKEGDVAGKDTIAERLKSDGELMEMSMGLQGMPKVLIRSSYPVDEALGYIEDYEIQPVFKYKGTGDNIEVMTEPWIFKDDEGVDSYSIYAATYVVSMFSQIHKILVG